MSTSLQAGEQAPARYGLRQAVRGVLFIWFILMLTALLANLVSNLVTCHSFYDQLKVQYIQEIHCTEEQVVIGKVNIALFVVVSRTI